MKTDIPAKLLTLKGGILLIPSRYEGFSLSLIEGMSQGLVPIVFPVGVAPEIIRNGENGYIVMTLAEAEDKIRLLLDDTVLRKRLSHNAQKTAEMFHSERLVKDMISLYQKILKKL
ncbi:MAG: glycosyltransferase [Patescibacteria group bacterium]